MATVRSGDITQLVLFGREFSPAADSSVTYKLAGYNTENTPTGDGKLHTKKTRKLGGFEAMTISLDPDNGDLEYLQGKQDAGIPGPCSMTLAGGQTYSGNLMIEGELNPNTGDGTLELAAMGTKFEKI